MPGKEEMGILRILSGSEEGHYQMSGTPNHEDPETEFFFFSTMTFYPSIKVTAIDKSIR